QRPLEAFITGFNYAKPPQDIRGSDDDQSDYVARDRAQALIREELAARSDAKSNHDAGRYYLSQRDFDRATKFFNKALQADPNSAELESDLGAAFLEKGSTLPPAQGRALLNESAGHLLRSIKLDGSLLPPRFNLGLLYERTGELEKARLAWREYLEA